ncbi:MAG: type II secretion system F family protein [Actinomycetota bacterium]
MRKRVVFATCGALLGLTSGSGLKSIVGSALLGALAWKCAELPAMRARRAKQEAVRSALPDALDLLVVCVHAGMGLDPALALVASSMEGPLRDALEAALRALDIGLEREVAYEALIAAADVEEVSALVAALRRADRYGTSIAATLSAYSAEVRERQLARIREHAMGAPVRMLFPLTLCFLPAFVLLAIAPSLIVAIRSFQKW